MVSLNSTVSCAWLRGRGGMRVRVRERERGERGEKGGREGGGVRVREERGRRGREGGVRRREEERGEKKERARGGGGEEGRRREREGRGGGGGGEGDRVCEASEKLPVALHQLTFSKNVVSPTKKKQQSQISKHTAQCKPKQHNTNTTQAQH